jgi:Adenylate and Guanylate cyclase catalytic domain
MHTLPFQVFATQRPFSSLPGTGRTASDLTYCRLALTSCLTVGDDGIRAQAGRNLRCGRCGLFPFDRSGRRRDDAAVARISHRADRSAHRGRIIKEMGDGMLIEFSSVVDAVRSSLAVQRAVTARNADIIPEQRLEFRIGIHVGDVLVQPNGDLLGDAVNIAARLETIAEPGGICLSEDAYRQVRDRLKERFIDLEERQLKNIARPIRVYAIEIKASGTAGKSSSSAKSRRSNPRPSRLSHPEPMRLPAALRVRAPNVRLALDTVERALTFIDKSVPAKLARLPRWTFARALLIEAKQTGKTRDLKAANRRLLQALRNDRWLEEVE